MGWPYKSDGPMLKRVRYGPDGVAVQHLVAVQPLSVLPVGLSVVLFPVPCRGAKRANLGRSAPPLQSTFARVSKRRLRKNDGAAAPRIAVHLGHEFSACKASARWLEQSLVEGYFPVETTSTGSPSYQLHRLVPWSSSAYTLWQCSLFEERRFGTESWQPQRPSFTPPASHKFQGKLAPAVTP
jgi:hypothetical protein